MGIIIVRKVLNQREEVIYNIHEHLHYLLIPHTLRENVSIKFHWLYLTFENNEKKYVSFSPLHGVGPIP